jgi:arylsulfatase A-like enzyme
MNVLLITLDSFMLDSFRDFRGKGAGCLDELFSKGRLFTDSIPSLHQTAPSHATILTGLKPERHGVLKNGDILRSRTIAEILSDSGYETAAAVGVWSLGSSKGFGRGFKVYHNYSAADPVLQVMAKNKMSKMFVVDTALKCARMIKKLLGINREKSDRSTERILKFFNKKPEGHFFCWLHYFDLHTNSVNEYWQGARKIDRNLDRITKRLKNLGLYEDTIIVVTADHSIVFKKGKGTCEDVSQVPLLFCHPSLQAGVIAERVSGADIMPTILSLLDREIPATDGRVILKWK